MYAVMKEKIVPVKRMSLNFVSLLLAVLSVTVTLSHGNSGLEGADKNCTKEAIVACYLPIIYKLDLSVPSKGGVNGSAPSEGGVNGSVPSGGGVNGSVPSGEEVCGEVETAAQCIDNEGCKDSDLFYIHVWHGLRDGVNYLCTDEDAKNVMKNASSTIKDPEVKEAVRQCNETFTESIQNDSNPFCPASKTMLECVSEAYERCGRDVQKVMVIFTHKFLSPMAKHVKCDLEVVDSLVGGNSTTLLTGGSGDNSTTPSSTAP